MASKASATGTSTNTTNTNPYKHTNNKYVMAQRSPSTLKLLSYNIDGLNDYETVYRTQIILGMILSEAPDVLHLQEVIYETYSLLRPALEANGYVCSGVSDTFAHYFTMSAVKQSRFSEIKFTLEDFTGKGKSHQGRILLKTSAILLLDRNNDGSNNSSSNNSSNNIDTNINNTNNRSDHNSRRHQCLFLNCHLESTGMAFKSVESQARIAQLHQGLQQLLSHQNNHVVKYSGGSGGNIVHSGGPCLLSGDLNIRDQEASFILKQLTVSDTSSRNDYSDSNNSNVKRYMKNSIDSSSNGVNIDSDYSLCAIVDVATMLKPPKSTYPPTWFLPDNNNHHQSSSEKKKVVSCRFDRVYINNPALRDIHSSSNSNNNSSNNNNNENDGIVFMPVSIETIGHDELFDAQDNRDAPYLTPSDHRGLVVVFALITADTNNRNHDSNTSDTKNESKSGRKRNLSEMTSMVSSNTNHSPVDANGLSSELLPVKRMKAVSDNISSGNSSTNKVVDTTNHSKKDVDIIDLT